MPPSVAGGIAVPNRERGFEPARRWFAHLSAGRASNAAFSSLSRAAHSYRRFRRCSGTRRDIRSVEGIAGRGDTLTVTDTSGSRVRGKLSQLSPSSLILDVSGAMREFRSGEVDRIEKRGADSLNNGALTGLAIGGGLGALVIGASVSDADPGWLALAALLYGGLGAGIGAGVDALIEGPRIIYAGPRAAKTTVSVSPILRGQRKGILLSFRR